MTDRPGRDALRDEAMMREAEASAEIAMEGDRPEREVEKVVEEIEREILEHSSDPRFAGHARLLGRISDTLRTLTAERDRLEVEVERLREALRTLVRGGVIFDGTAPCGPDTWECVYCWADTNASKGGGPEDVEHDDDCPLNNAARALEPEAEG